MQPCAVMCNALHRKEILAVENIVHHCCVIELSPRTVLIISCLFSDFSMWLSSGYFSRKLLLRDESEKCFSGLLWHPYLEDVLWFVYPFRFLYFLLIIFADLLPCLPLALLLSKLCMVGG